MMKLALAPLLALGLASCAVDDSEYAPARVHEAALTDPGEAPSPPARFVRHADAIPNRYIVVLKSDVQGVRADVDGSIARLASAHGADVAETYNVALQGFAAAMSESDAQALADDPEVAFVEQDFLVHTTASQADATWGLDRVDQPALPLDTRYKYVNGGTGVTAYILDTGIRATHGEFAGRILPGFTSINDGQGTNDCHAHGTHVSGTVAGKILGISKAASVVPVRVLDCTGTGPASGIIAGLEWVAANRRLPAVANMSLGGPASAAEDTAVRNLIAAGVTVVVAAGNENADACLNSPARVPQAITVAASSNTDARASFSNFGTCVDLFAPGVNILSASISGDTLARPLSGTSQASPHVAGAVAMYLAANPTATPASVAQALVTHATLDKITDANGSPNRLLNTMFVDTTPPVAAITSPANGATVGASFMVDLNITDQHLETVQLSIDGQVSETRTTGPFGFPISGLAGGMHTIAIVATDAAGQKTNAQVQVTVQGKPGVDSDDDYVVTSGCSTGGSSGFPVVLGLALALLGLRRRSARPPQ